MKDEYSKEELEDFQKVKSRCQEVKEAFKLGKESDDGWKNSGHSAGIDVLSRQGLDDNPHSVEAFIQTTIQAPSVKIASHLFYRAGDDDELIEKRNDHNFMWYRYTDFPPPLKDRGARA